MRQKQFPATPKRAAALSGLCLLTASLLAADGWERTERGFRTGPPERTILVQPDGSLRIRHERFPEIAVAFFYWHDAWIYERLERGTVAEPATITDEGTLRMAGAWGTRAGVPPLRYTLEISPDESGVGVLLTTTKTAPLKLTAGLWCIISIPTLDKEPRRIHARPVAETALGRDIGGTVRTLFVGIPGKPAVTFAGNGFRSMRSRIGTNRHGIEMCLAPADFAVGTTAETRFRIGFAPMPTEFPGRIRGRRRPLAIQGVKTPSGPISLFDKIELTVALEASWDNPFDPEDITLDAIVSLPSGRTYTQPGFFILPHKRVVQQGAEIMVPTGPGQWRVRLAATEVGTLRCELRARDRSGTTRFVLPAIAVAAGSNRGFLRKSPVDPRYFRYDDGSPFVPIGHNLPIYPSTGQLVDEALERMSAAGENYNRWWMSNAGLGLEWGERLGWYRQAEAARLDHALQLAQRLGMVFMLCMDTHQDFRQARWKANPFNAANGGPCNKVEEWFTSEAAKMRYRKRLRYTVARWAADPGVLCWEFGNEFEGWENTSEKIKIDWHREMAAYLARLDPYDHPVTTSWWSKTGPEACWEIPEIGIVQTHCYTNNDRNVA